MPMRSVRIFLFLFCAVTPAHARHPGDPIKPGFNLFSKFQDIQVGQAAAYQVQRQYRVVNDPYLQDYVKRIGDRLASTPEARQSGFQFTFTVLSVPQVNAFALPGGPMFIFTGIFNAAENEAQLAGVMAHEMSHVILRHGTHEASKARLVNLSAVLAGAAAGGGTAMGQLAQMGLGLGANSLILKFSREAESEADLLGSHLLSESGYNPLEMARFFEKLASTGNQGIQFFSDHPNPDNRERAIEAEIRGLPQHEYGYQAGDFSRARNASQAALTAAPNVRASAPAPPVAELSGSWASYRSTKFAVSYPAAWKIDFNPDATGLRVAPPDGVGTGPNGSPQIVTGVLFGHFTPTVGRDNLGTATLELVGFLHNDRPALQLSNTPQRNLRVDGVPALMTSLLNGSPSGGVENDALLTVMRPDGVFYVLFAAPHPEFVRLESVFQQILASLHFVNGQ